MKAKCKNCALCLGHDINSNEGPMLTNQDITKLKGVFSTKEDQRQFRDEIRSKFSTKDDLHQLRDEIRSKFATKDDLHQLRDEIRSKFATKQDLFKLRDEIRSKFATKKDLHELRDDFFTRIDAVLYEIQAMREELTIIVYRQREHGDRLDCLEEKLSN
jgi:TPP-dependent pyruvate/acetoin dehydrogenase alpha subunit